MVGGNCKGGDTDIFPQGVAVLTSILGLEGLSWAGVEKIEE